MIDSKTTATSHTEKETKNVGIEEPWRDAAILREKYHGEGLYIHEIADEFDVHPRTVRDWMERHGIDRRDGGQQRLERCTFRTTRGYEISETKVDGEAKSVRIHRLLAVAEFGFDEVVDKHVHHGPVNIPWANWPDNLQVMDASEHIKHHHREFSAFRRYKDKTRIDILHELAEETGYDLDFSGGSIPREFAEYLLQYVKQVKADGGGA